MTSRELVYQTLEFRNKDNRVPRDLWTLPWAEARYPYMMKKIKEDYPPDIVTAPTILKVPTISKGDIYALGEYIDPWGCRIYSIQEGVHGEVKKPLVKEEEWEDVENVHIPTELLTFDVDQVNAFCKNTDKFVKGGCCPRPFEQLQFIRGSENLFMDLAEPPKKMLEFMSKMHSFYCDLVEKWAKTDVDAIMMMDDWGSQRSLLINPISWDAYFKPMYKDYIDIAKRYGKKTFMHSDGYTLDIYPRLIELGLDAFNSQIFCMGLDNLTQYKGKITFWGEIDRQELLSYATPEQVEHAVQEVYEKLWDNGGCIAQCEFGAGGKPENVYTVYETWAKLR